jgi:hypothetical protein
MNDDFLYKYQKAPRREFAAGLYKRISKPMKTTTRTQSLRSFALALSLVMLIGAGFLFSPSTGALADSLVRRFGVFTFVQAPPEPKAISNETYGPQVAGSQQKNDAIQDQRDPLKKQPGTGENATATYAQDAAAASQLAGFAVLAPIYIPDGYTLENASGEWAVLHENDEVRTSITYAGPDESSFLTIEQLQHQPGQSKQVESQQIVDVTVRGQPGAWLPEHQKNLLVWEEDGVTYLVVSHGLPLEEVVKVAESLER